jgi:glycosyltransferase involved in cell wall biosynthesis
MTFVSIIIPCFNVEPFVAECIESALAQTYSDTEIICIDNNSTDNTWKVISAYAQKYLGKIIADKESKRGAPAARNKGLSLAKGEWIQFLDADDLLMPTKLEHQVKILQTETHAEIIIGNMIKNFVKSKDVLVGLHKANIWEALIKGGAGCTCSNLYRMSALKSVNGWKEDQRSSQEAYLLFSLLKAGKVTVFDEEPLTYIRERASGSITSSARKDNWVRYIGLRVEIWIYLAENRMLTPSIELTLKRAIFDSIRSLYKLDPKEAHELYEKYVLSSYEPVESPLTTNLYLTFYRLFGFRIAQQFRKPLGLFR